MKISKNIFYKSFKRKTDNKKISKLFKHLIKENNQILKSLADNYPNKFTKKKIMSLKKFNDINLIGMGGSILGSKSIYNFLRKRIKKNFNFIDNFHEFQNISNKKKMLNLIISKSGNTLETIANFNVISKKNHENIFITENKSSYLKTIATKLKSDVIDHNNYIGGRYSVLSEVGMLPAELMGLNQKKFKRYNYLIKDRNFINSLISNVSGLLNLIKKKKSNSIIINYDKNSTDFFNWYQQLVAESLGKKKQGILPVISNMPADNHSLMQLYLDGPKNNFFTLFFSKEKSPKKILNKNLLDSHFYLKGKNLNDISYKQFSATESIFSQRNIPFRSFFINNRSEETLGELFTFFILETILLAKALRINPYDQPAVEILKKKTKNLLLRT